MNIVAAARLAASDVASPGFRKILWKSIGLALLLFMILFAAFQFALSYLDFPQHSWAEPVIAILAGAGLILAFVFLAVPVTAIFAGLYLDHIAELVERTHYPEDPVGEPPPAVLSILVGLRFALIALLVNLMALPLLFLGIGAIVMVLANAYLLSREYFEMTSLRHMPREEASRLRREHARAIYFAGLLPALIALVPFANLILPMFATSYFTHIFKSFEPSEVPASSAGRGTGRG
jgi:CysZ protein